MKNIVRQCFAALLMVVDRYNIEFHHISIGNPCKTTKIHAKSMEITIGFPIGMLRRRRGAEKVGTMLHLIFGLRRAWGRFPAGCELATRCLKDCCIDFRWLLAEIIIFQARKFEIFAE